MTERPSITVQTPLGHMRAIFNGGGRISLRDLTETVWDAEAKSFVSGHPIQINGVQYRASFTGQKDAVTGEWVETYASIDRDGSVKAYDYSPAALRKFRETMPKVCADLAEKHADLLRASEIARLTDEFAAAVQKADKLAEELNQAQADARRLREELTQAQADAGELDGEQMEKRYLTRAELAAIANETNASDLVRHLLLTDHAPGSGACLEIVLSVAQAREVDLICEHLRIGQ